MMEKAQMRLSFKNATVVVCFFNLVAFLLFFRGFFSSSYSRKLSLNPSSSAELKYIKESEAIRRSMEPLELIKRVKEIKKEANVEPEAVQQEDNKQTAAANLISRLNNFRSYSDAASLKALEDWRKRKMERARQRELGKNGTVVPLA